MPYLVQENRRQAGATVRERAIVATNRRVVVLGGGDTGADCVATAHRQGAATVTQVDVNTMRPRHRPPDNPWPEPPVTHELTYAQAEGSVDVYGFETRAFDPDPGGETVAAVRGQRVSWTYTPRRKRLEKTIRAGDARIPADLVLVAVGFEGPDVEPFDGAIELTATGTLCAGPDMQTNLAGVFAAGDAAMGQSIVVWAIGEGRDAARAIDIYLSGSSSLPASLRTANAPTQWYVDPATAPK